MEIKITKAQTLKEKPDSSSLGFGKIFTDHMFMMDWNDEKGWYTFNYSCSTSFNQIQLLASDGIFKSPLGDTDILPTFGPSGKQERLYCCEKNLL